MVDKMNLKRYKGEFNVFLYLLFVSLFGIFFLCLGFVFGDVVVVYLLWKNYDVYKYGK